METTYGEHPTCSLKNNVFVNNNGINSFLIICVSTCWQLVLARNIQQTCVILTYIYIVSSKHQALQLLFHCFKHTIEADNLGEAHLTLAIFGEDTGCNAAHILFTDARVADL